MRGGSGGFAPSFGGMQHFAPGLVLGEACLDKPLEESLEHAVSFLSGGGGIVAAIGGKLVAPDLESQEKLLPGLIVSHSGGLEQGDQLAVADGKSDVIQRGNAAEMLADIF